MIVPKKTPRDTIALSPSLAHLTSVKGGKQEDVWRCPICGTPYATEEDMKVCVGQPVDRTVQANLGVDVGDAITFVYMPRKLEELIFSGKVKEADVPDTEMQKFNGSVSRWIMVRTPRGHEALPVVIWKYQLKLLESWLVPKPPNAVMCATPSRTRDTAKNRHPF